MADAPLLLIRPGSPDFLELPWDRPLNAWGAAGAAVEDVPIGICRHPVIFVRVEGQLYAFKELPEPQWGGGPGAHTM